MAFEVTMPQLGADMVEGTLLRWRKQVGERVERGEIVADIETDKATVELEAFEAGTLLRHLVAEGTTVPVGEAIALVGDGSEPVPEARPLAQAAEPLRRPTDTATAAIVRDAEARTANALPTLADGAGDAADEVRLRISPVARRIALEAGLDVRQLRGTGPDGRILRRDVDRAIGERSAHPPVQAAPSRVPTETAAPPPRGAPTGTIPLSRLRQATARRMVQSKQQQPHYYLAVGVDMTDALAFREQFNAVAGEARRASINDLIVKACALALGRHPRFNSEFREDGVLLHDEVNIAIGVALDDGLIAPALLDCGSKSLGELAEAARDLVTRARSGTLRADEYSRGTFTVTNLGAFGVESLIGIINPPQAAILGVGAVTPRPVVRDGQVVVRQVMTIALSADHRVTDGVEGARFIKEIQAILERPAGLAI